MDEKKGEVASTQIGLHAVRNLLGEQTQTTLFSEHDQEFSQEYGINLSGKIERFGIDLTEIESRIMEGILHAINRTGYRGNIESVLVEDIAEEKYSGKVPEIYKYIKEVPVVRIKQSEILRFAGVNDNSIASKTRAVEAIQELGTKQYCFYYNRLAYDQSGKPVKNNDGSWKKEQVVAVDTLFTIKEVRKESNDQLDYYEISPSAIFLDQRESYFMLVPYNWREEVRHLVGKRKASSYTFLFLLFLRYQFELKRRSKKQSSPYQIKWNPEEIASAIKMPESVFKRKKKRMNQILEDAYSVAKSLGYIKDYERLGHVDVLQFNDKKYHNPNRLEFKGMNQAKTKGDPGEVSVEEAVFEYFHEQRRVLDPQHVTPSGCAMKTQVKELETLLKTRSKEDVEKLIKWSVSKKYWCSRLSTPAKLRQHFSESWTEMMNSEGLGEENRIEINKMMAKEWLTKVRGNSSGIRAEMFSKYVEIGNGVQQPYCVEYDAKDFKEKLEYGLKKWQLL